MTSMSRHPMDIVIGQSIGRVRGAEMTVVVDMVRVMSWTMDMRMVNNYFVLQIRRIKSGGRTK